MIGGSGGLGTETVGAECVPATPRERYIWEDVVAAPPSGGISNQLGPPGKFYACVRIVN